MTLWNSWKQQHSVYFHTSTCDDYTVEGYLDQIIGPGAYQVPAAAPGDDRRYLYVLKSLDNTQLYLVQALAACRWDLIPYNL